MEMFGIVKTRGGYLPHDGQAVNGKFVAEPRIEPPNKLVCATPSKEERDVVLAKLRGELEGQAFLDARKAVNSKPQHEALRAHVNEARRSGSRRMP